MEQQALIEALQSPMALWDMPSFLNEYTLHDSGFREAKITPYAGVIVLIDWDLHWNKVVPMEFGLLAIQFRVPYFVLWSQGTWMYSTLDNATSNFVSDVEKERMLAESSLNLSNFLNAEGDLQPYMFDDGLTRTVFQMMNFGAIELTHGKGVNFSCFNERGDAYYIPHITRHD